MEKTFSIVQKALNITDEQSFLTPPRPPLTDGEFRGFLDSVGRIMCPDQLRRVIYIGGIDPSLRRVVWKHILNVYPDGMTGKERMDYMKRKAAEYHELREVWRTAVQTGCNSGELAYVTSMVRKDVLRTDRMHPFYAGHDDNQNIASLFNILTTYALNHPAVSYCQGMSDIASTLLVTMNDEAHAYICFCAVMRRLYMNFLIDGLAMTQKFAHLTEALQFYDQEFFEYLRSQQADDLLFCYRWLLLEMKREFAFSDSLRMLEVLWSSLPADPPEKELVLVSRNFVPTPASCNGEGGEKRREGVAGDGSATAPRETVYTKICALRRQNSAMSLSSSVSPGQVKSPSPGGPMYRFNQSLDESQLERGEKEQESPAPKTNLSLEERKFVFPTEATVSVTSKEQQQQGASGKGPVVVKRVQTNTNPFLSPSNLSPGGHFKELKERLVKKSGFSMKITTPTEDDTAADEGGRTPKKVVKSFNEFLNFASPGNKKWRRTDSREEVELDVSAEDGEKNKSSNKNNPKKEKEEEEEESSPDDTQEYFPMTTPMTRELRLDMENLDRQVFGAEFQEKQRRREEEQLHCDTPPGEGYKKLSHRSTDTYDEGEEEGGPEEDEDPDGISKCPDNKFSANGLTAVTENEQRDLEKRLSTCSMNNDVFVWENPLNQFPSSASQASLTQPDSVEIEMVPQQSSGLSMCMFVDPIELSNQMANSSCEEAAEAAALMTISGNPLNMSIRVPGTLPPPPEFGGGNPFLMFLSLTLLLQHRDYVMKNGLDYNEMAMHFDKMVRKHNVTRTLNQARQMYSDYLASFKGRLQGEGVSVNSNMV